MTFYDLQKMYNANNDKALAFSKAQYSEINMHHNIFINP